jgi:hypothetical protein
VSIVATSSFLPIPHSVVEGTIGNTPSPFNAATTSPDVEPLPPDL